jgi:dihydroxyacetone kinase-like predicted kinase
MRKITLKERDNLSVITGHITLTNQEVERLLFDIVEKKVTSLDEVVERLDSIRMKAK